MRNLTQSLETLRRQRTAFSEAVENVLRDVRSENNEYGNLPPNLVASLDQGCGENEDVEQVVRSHRCLEMPLLHCRAPAPTGGVQRVMAKRFFVTYQVLEGAGAADESEIDPWLDRLSPGSHRLAEDEMQGRTGRRGEPCWWTFKEQARPTPDDGSTYARELALGAAQCRQAGEDGALVEISFEGRSVEPLFKPTSLEGFGPDTLFRPELTGADHGRTAPVDVDDRGWPELVGASHRYEEILEPEAELEVLVLPYGDE